MSLTCTRSTTIPSSFMRRIACLPSAVSPPPFTAPKAQPVGVDVAPAVGQAAHAQTQFVVEIEETRFRPEGIETLERSGSRPPCPAVCRGGCPRP